VHLVGIIYQSNRHTCRPMRSVGVHCMQPASPATVNKEEGGVGFLFFQYEISTEKTAWKCYRISKWVCDNRYIKTNQIITARNNCIAIRFLSHLCHKIYFSLVKNCIHSIYLYEKGKTGIKAIFLFNPV